MIYKNRSLRFGLVVFIGLVIFCLAQLTWWIIFQISRENDLHDLKKQILKQELAIGVFNINRQIDQLAEEVELIYHYQDRNQLRAGLDSLIIDSPLEGYFFTSMEKEFVSDGLADKMQSSNLIPYGINDNLIIYFNVKLIDSLIAESGVYAIEGNSPAPPGFPLSPDMFKLNLKLVNEMDDELIRKNTMIIAESSFFLLIMILGAFLIYRTLQRSEELKERQVSFIQTVSHEFRTPLTSLRLYLETLGSGRIESDNAPDIYNKMLIDCDRLDTMVDNVLEAGYYSHEKYELNLIASDLGDGVEDHLANLEPFLKRQNTVLKRNIERHVMVRIDYQAIGRVIRALVDNAVKYSLPDRKEVSVRVFQKSNFAYLEVEDQGIGIPMNESNTIFERFYRIPDTRSAEQKGTGLGLFIVKQIIDAHKGEISVYSGGRNKGTTFTVKLPLVK